MTNSNSTEVALDALPLLYHPLAEFDRFIHIRCPLSQPLMIASPNGSVDSNPVEDLEYPIQIIPQPLGSDHVRLGIYIPPSMQLFQGPEPDSEWLQHLAETYPPLSNPVPLRSTLVGLYDKLCNLVELHYFYYEAVHSLMKTEDFPTTNGIWRFSNWLQELEEDLKQQFGKLCKQLRIGQFRDDSPESSSDNGEET